MMWSAARLWCCGKYSDCENVIQISYIYEVYNSSLFPVLSRIATGIMTPPRTHISPNPIPWQETEVVFINSSPGLKVGPNPRVIKRQNSCYMRPCSPLSPTTSRLEVNQFSGSLAARLKNEYSMTPGKWIWICALELIEFASDSHF